MVTPVNSRQSNYHLSEKLLDAVRRRADAATIQSLLEAGADVNARDSNGDTPFLLACSMDDEDRVHQLIKAGADVNYSNNGYRTPLHYVVLHGWTETIKLLAKNNVDLDAKGSFRMDSPIMVACFSEKRNEIVELLINLGSDVRYCDANKATALHFASSHGLLEIAQLLLKKGADPNARDWRGETPLHKSCRFIQVKVTEHLLKAGADCRIKDRDGKTPFRHLIIEREPDVESIRLLIFHGAYIEPSDYSTIFNRALLKEGVLQDIKTCSQAILNKFNNKDLPLVYSLPMFEKILPPIELMKIGSHSEKLMEIELTVKNEIRGKGYCNVLKARPLVLSMMCVKFMIDCYFTNHRTLI